MDQRLKSPQIQQRAGKLAYVPRHKNPFLTGVPKAKLPKAKAAAEINVGENIEAPIVPQHPPSPPRKKSLFAFGMPRILRRKSEPAHDDEIEMQELAPTGPENRQTPQKESAFAFRVPKVLQTKAQSDNDVDIEMQRPSSPGPLDQPSPGAQLSKSAKRTKQTLQLLLSFLLILVGLGAAVGLIWAVIYGARKSRTIDNTK
ncbi:hypothetical protein EDC01DRAFT_635311 [Geopyxis carbonaria]|nr:hypothetical protein EDC01DRAFT_635311 [Geopyxis carbonaria]